MCNISENGKAKINKFYSVEIKVHNTQTYLKGSVNMGRLLKTTLLAGATLYGLNRLNQRLTNKQVEWHPPHIDDILYHQWHEGHIAYSKKGSGTPLLLLHGMGAGASSYEYRYNIDELSTYHMVYAFDFLGFGLSDKPRVHYSAESMVYQLEHFIDHVIKQPVKLVASTHSAAYAIRLAYLRPELVNKLVLITPIGLDKQLEKGDMLSDMLRRTLFTVPVVNQSLYQLIASKINIRQFLSQSMFHHPEQVTEDVVENYYLSAHRGGQFAYLAPNAFIRGKLNLDISLEWEQLKLPTFIAWGAKSTLIPVEEMSFYKLRKPDCITEVFQSSSLLPHDEQAYLFNDWLSNVLK